MIEIITLVAVVKVVELLTQWNGFICVSGCS